jgi:HEAT repeat protein
MRWKINHILAWGSIFIFGWACGVAAAEKPVNTGEVIAKIRKQCYVILQQALKSEEAFVRSGAARAVGESEDPALIPLLEKGAKDFYPTTRQFALQGISGLSKKKARTLGRERLDDSNVWVKSTALGLLADLNDTESIDVIKPLLKAPDRMVRLAAAYTLVRLGEEQYFSELTRAVNGGDIVHRFQAITYLGKIGDDVSLRLLKDLLESDEEQVLSASLKALGEQADMELFRPLVKLSLHESPTVRRNAVLALSYLPPKAVTKQVKLFCTDPDPLVQLSAALAMHRLKSTECRHIFTELMDHKDFAVRASTARVLGKVDIPDRTRLLAKALGDGNTRVRTAATRSAGQMGGPEAFQLLIQMLDDPQEVIRAYAAGNLLRLIR